MTLFEYMRVALSSVVQNKVRASLTMLGVTIGVMAVILLVALGEAAQIFVQGQFDDMGTNLLIVTPGKQETTGMMPLMAGAYHKLTWENAKEIDRKVAGIRHMSPEVIGSARVRFWDRQRDTMVFGGTPPVAKIRNVHVETGRFLNDTDIERNQRVCVLGSYLAEELFGNENPLYKKISINRAKHTVVGVLERKGQTLGFNIDDVVVIPLNSAQNMFYGGDDEVFQIVMQANSPDDTERILKKATEVLTAAHDYTEDFTIIDQTAMLSSLDQIFLALKVMLAGIASISLLVGGIGIMNIMLVSVRERTREVGIRKAVGASGQDIGIQFLIESMTVSCLGGVIGILLAFGGTFIIRWAFSGFPVYCSTWSILVAFFFSATVGIFFGVYPAMKASSVDPVEALRYE